MKNLLVCTLLFASALTLNAQVANTRIYNAEKLAKVKEKADSPLYAPAVKTLLRDADKALKMTPPSVMDKTMTADSGDKHDYMSMGPYWWPDPSKPDGLPYIRKDGQRNPELDKLDRNKLGDMSKAVTTLGLAYYFSGDEKYAQKAVDFLNVWFLDAKTKMNPNLTYGQTIPGKNKGMGHDIDGELESIYPQSKERDERMVHAISGMDADQSRSCRRTESKEQSRSGL